MIEKAGSNSIKVIIGLPTPFDDDYYEKLLSRIRSWLTEYARESNIATIDFAAGFYDAEGELRSELLLADGGHPSLLGYQEMFKQINLDIFKN
jgi:lysophospholipase L1-like esterase